MDELIKVHERNGKQLVNGRELHYFLDSKTRYNDWIKYRIEKYGFIENQDYISFTENLVKPQVGRPSTDYGLTIDMAKELCMIENNAKGRQARRYFIAMERKAREQKALDFSDPAAVLDMAKKWYDTQVEKERLKMQNELQQNELKEAAPKVQYHDDVIQSHSTHSINVIAKELGMSAIRLNKLLQAMRVQYKQGGQWLLYAKHQNKGYTKTRTTTFTDSKGEMRTNVYTVWTERGRKFIHEKVSAYKAINK